MNKLVPLGLAAAAVAVALVIGTQLLRPAAPGGVAGAPSSGDTVDPSPARFGGMVQYQLDGIAASTDVDVVADGADVSGTAVTTLVSGIHTVQLECASRDGDFWAVGGTIVQTTVAGERAGDWSAVIVKDGSPQRIGIWLSDTKAEGIDCDGWLAAIDIADIGPENFEPVASGTLVPPPDLAP